MPRQPRLDTPGALHHVIGRGIDGIEIFGDKKDRLDFIDRLKKLCESEAIIIYAWALMRNHYHLLIRTGKISLSNIKREWQDRDTILAYFGKMRKRATERYEEFIADGIKEGRRPDLVGGGLIRSLGGWSQVLSLRRAGSKVFSDERILGSSEFVNNVITDVEERDKETLRLNSRISDLNSLAKVICKSEGVEEEVLRSGFRKRSVVKSRRIFCQVAVKRMGYSGADVARFLGINTSAVNRLAASDELHEIKKYL